MLFESIFGVDWGKVDCENTNFFTHGTADILISDLESKTLYGLFLRLQFWITQIGKSLMLIRGNRKSTLKYGEKQKIQISSILSFLIYMRDSVKELHEKKVEERDNFEWQK
jgi:hypothetical protein